MLYQVLHVPKGELYPPRKVIHLPELSRYVRGWGRKGDRSFLASNAVTDRYVGTVWLMIYENKGYGYVDTDTPELSMAGLIIPS
jgi:hypothetical protein